MNEQLLIYLIGMSERLAGGLIATGSIGLIIIVGTYFFYKDDCWHYISKAEKIISSSLAITLGLVCSFLFLLGVLLPNSKTALALIAYPHIKSVAENKETKEIPANVIKFINNYLKEEVKK